MVKRTTKHSERLDLTFSMFMSAVDRLEKKIIESGKKYKNIYAIPRGGVVLGLCLSHRLKLPMISWSNAIKSNTLVVDDICDTAITLSRYSKNDRVAIVTKMAGLDSIPDLMYAYGVADHIWVRFWWEKDDT